MTLPEICRAYGYSQSALARRFGIPLRTVQNWHSGANKAPDYLLRMMQEILDKEKDGG